MFLFSLSLDKKIVQKPGLDYNLDSNFLTFFFLLIRQIFIFFSLKNNKIASISQFGF